MSVSPKEITTLDKNSGKAGENYSLVHYIRVGKTNRKGAAETFGGILKDHVGHKKLGDFHIELTTRVNGRVKHLIVKKDDIVFRTGTHNRWQVLTRTGFNKRFPQAKV